MSWRINGLAAIGAGLVLAAMLWIARLRHPTPTCILPPRTLTTDQLAQVRQFTSQMRALLERTEREDICHLNRMVQQDDSPIELERNPFKHLPMMQRKQ